jgi:hypothetical protein
MHGSKGGMAGIHLNKNAGTKNLLPPKKTAPETEAVDVH